MSKKITATIDIEKGVGEVYSFVAKMENLPFWTEIKSAEKISGTGEVGTIYNLTVKSFLTKKIVPVEITQKLAHAKFAYRDTTVSVQNEIGYIFSEESGKTVVTAYREVGLGSLAYLLTLNFLTDRDTKKQLEESLASLKEFIERE
jgi:hypothetical protein